MDSITLLNELCVFAISDGRLIIEGVLLAAHPFKHLGDFMMLQNSLLYRFIYEYYENREFNVLLILMYGTIASFATIIMFGNGGIPAWITVYSICAGVMTVIRIPTVKTQQALSALRKQEIAEYRRVHTPNYLFYLAYTLMRKDFKYTTKNVLASSVKYVIIWGLLIAMIFLKGNMVLIPVVLSYSVVTLWIIVCMCSKIRGY